MLEPSGVTVFNNGNFRLVLDGRRYSFGDANTSSIGFYWTNHGLSWSEDDTVSARLVQSGGSSAPPSDDPLTASLESAPDAHDGESAFRVRVAFSEAIATSYQDLDEGFTVTGGAITSVRRVDRRSDLWELEVAPSDDDDVTLELAGGRACSVTGAPCTDDGRTLSETLTVTVPGPEEEASETPLTARIDDFPAEHDGSGKFEVRIAFSEAIRNSYKHVDDAASAAGGSVTSAKRVDGRSDLWLLRVLPDGHSPVTVTLAGGGTCGADRPAVLCTSDGRALSNTVSITVRGPAGLSVADAEAHENDDETIDFTVSLDRSALRTITVDYATSDGTATAGADYTAKSGTLTFTVGGQRSKTVRVPILDDSHDEGEETFTLTLSSASGAVITDGEATGTIENHDPLPRGLMARFGRAAAVHVVEHVEERLQAPREPGFEGRFAGRALRPGMEREMALNFLSRLGGAAGITPIGAGGYGPMAGLPSAGAGSLGMPGLGGDAGMGMAAGAGPMGGGAGLGAMGGGAAMGSMGGGEGGDGQLNGRGLLRMGLGGGDLLTGSSFALNRETRHGGILSFWSRGARSSFYGQDGTLALNGDVRTTMFGADYAKGRMVAGLSLARSQSLGGYQGEGAGQVDSAVTGLYPWLGYQISERVSVWGVTGYGSGSLVLTPGDAAPLESGLSMAMAAGGTRGELVAGGAGGFALAFKADALWVGTGIDGVDGPAGRLQATEAAVMRLRTGLEGSRDFRLGGALSLKPIVEVGLRHDGGDAETGAGMDLGGGLTVSAALEW